MTDTAILLVEGDPAQRELTRLALRECCDAARIATAADHTEAMNFLLGRGADDGRDARKQPRLVIIGIQPGRMDGLHLARAIRGNPVTQAIPVVMLSSSNEKSELGNCYEAGANSVVLRSADPEELRRKMQRVYEFWVTVNEANRNSRV